MGNLMYEKVISNSNPFDLVLNIRDDLIQNLNNCFDSNLFECYWNMSLKMTLAGIKGKIEKKDLLSKEYLDILEEDNYDIRNIYFNAIYDRAVFINKYVDYIVDEESLYPIIFSKMGLSRNIDSISARTLLIKLGYLDITFCKKNIHKLNIANMNMINKINYLYEIYDDSIDYFSSMQDLSEEDRVEKLKNHPLFFRLINENFEIKNYYRDLNTFIS